MKQVHVETDDIRRVIGQVRALACATPTCPGEGEPYNAGVTCLRCHAVQSLNSWLPEGERERGISDEEEGERTCRDCGAVGVCLNVAGSCEGGCEEEGEDFKCRKCGEYADGGDGYDGMCPSCADKANGGDLCDTCGASGVQIDHTDDDGNTVCTECAEGDENK